MKTQTILIGLVVLVVVAGAVILTTKPADTVKAEPLTFEECATLYPVMESYPRQCSTPSGKFFTEEVPEQEAVAVGIPDLISVTAPAIGQTITSPLTLTGSARGTWYFEASFPIEIRDSADVVIGTGYAEAQSDWMTENFVDFIGTVTFTPQPAGSMGTVVLKKDNPSGLPENDNSVVIPVQF